MSTSPGTTRNTAYADAASLRRLRLSIGRRLDGLLQGENLAGRPGPGSEPADARPYGPGDDVRRIDWSATARTLELQVRTTVAERELETTVLVDGSASMDLGSSRMEKRALALAATAAVAHLTDGPGNRLGGVLLGADGLKVLQPRGGRKAQLALLHAVNGLGRAEPGARTPTLLEGIHRLEQPVRRRGLAVVISDFAGDPAVWMRSLRRLSQRHHVMALELLDPRDLSLPAVGYLRLVDPESGRELEIQTSKAEVRRRFAAAAVTRRNDIAAALLSSGAEHVRLQTDRDWLTDFARHIASRKKGRPAVRSIA